MFVCLTYRPSVNDQHQRMAVVVATSEEAFGPEREQGAGLLKHLPLVIQMEAGLQQRLHRSRAESLCRSFWK